MSEDDGTNPTELIVPDAVAWREWLAHHHTEQAGTWLVLARAGTTRPTSLSYQQALDEALCHGWIDGQVRRRDEGTFRRRFTPRRARGPWSARNVGLVAELTEQGRMHPAGLAEVARARADGRWDAAYPGPAAARVPEDLAAALAADTRAQALFDVLTSQNRYALLHRLSLLKTPGGRARRVADTVRRLAAGETPYPRRRSPADPVE